MKRTLREKHPKVIIEISDSENEGKESLDDSYVPDEPEVKRKPKAKKATNTKTDKKATSKVTGLKKEKTKATKRKQDANKDQEPKEKKQKITKSKEEVNESKNLKEEPPNLSKDDLKEKLNSIFKTDIQYTECNEWTDVDYLSEVHNIDQQIARNVVKLFNEENTIPFIARYRKNMTGSMEADQLRLLKDSFDQAKVIKNRAATILKTIDKLGQWTPEIHSAIVSTKHLDDLEHIYSLFKPAAKRSLAERARELGLGTISNSVLQGKDLPYLSSLIDPNKEGLKTEQQVKDGIIHIIADIINKDKTVFDKVKNLQKSCTMTIQTSKNKTTETQKVKKKDVDESKYEMYYDFTISDKSIKPHHILAINRGEAQKILNVKVNISDFFEKAFKGHCLEQYKAAVRASKLHATLLHDSIDYAYKKFIKPLVIRRLRTELKEKAEVASIEVFVTNVKQLLLTSPVRGKVILGIDPGFHHGCKLAVVSEQGNVLETGVIFPHKNSKLVYEDSANKLIKMINKHKCTILALGNATACRETESFLTSVIKSEEFGPLNISYTIVDESGASIYSCSPEAKTEFPDLDPNIISAISIARRLQDPLAELVKVDPKHLGVGMYQHDLPEKQLLQALNEVVSEAVSFVGVDVNTASHCLLKRVAGLNVSRANSIIEWRTKHGPFKNREQLLDVKGIGNKTFEQCAGFIRILPETSTSTDSKIKRENVKNSKNTLNLLDQTWIHPESYKIANMFLKYCRANLEDFGKPAFIEQIKSCAKDKCAVLAEQFHTDETTMEIIIKGLTMRKDEDIRLKANYPLFRNGMLSVNDLSVGTGLTGAIKNVTHFGAFVDIGVGRNGLIHSKNMKGQTLSVGQRVEVQVLSLDIQRGRIGLKLIKVL